MVRSASMHSIAYQITNDPCYYYYHIVLCQNARAHKLKSNHVALRSMFSAHAFGVHHGEVRVEKV